jgi:hypothetical protein
MRKKISKVAAKKAGVAKVTPRTNFTIHKRHSVYVSGPMSGIPNHNAEAFNEAARRLRAIGYKVLNPAENDNGSHDKGWVYYMHLDIKHVVESDMLVMLEGWEHSKGAQLEVAVARRLEKQIHLYNPDEVDRPVGQSIYPRAVVRVTTEEESPSEEAFRIVRTDRRKDYGRPLQDYRRTSGMMTALIKHKMRDGQVITPQDAMMFMLLVKISREQNKHKRDNLVDICGYAECLQMTEEDLEEESILKGGTAI